MSDRAQLDDMCATAHAPTASNGAFQFGSNVSRLKSRFLQQLSDVTDHTSHRASPPPSTTTSPATPAFLLDMSDHVEKFRHTRALFAQLAEQGVATRPPPVPRSTPRSFRSASSASPPPTRPSHVHPARRSVSPSSDLHSARSLAQTRSLGQTRSCNGVTTWLQLGSRSLDENPRSGAGLLSSLRSHLGSENGSRLQPGSTSSVETSRSEVTSRSSSRRGEAVETTEVSTVVLRRSNPSNLDVATSRAVLLPKRRSREEKSLTVSKDCLEASLYEADEYWRRQQIEDYTAGDVDPLMSESTFSSGSGEEMAMSESGHDIAAALNDSMVSPTADSAEIWSRRLSAAMEAKSSEADSCRGGAAVDCNGTGHVISRTVDNGVTVTSSRSLRGRCDLENAAGCSESACETMPCSAADYTHCVTVQHEYSTTLPTTVDLSRSFEPSRSSDVLCDVDITAGGSAAVSETAKGSATDYSQPTDNGGNLPTAVSCSRSSASSRSSSAQCDLENIAGDSATVSDARKRNSTELSEDATFEVDTARTPPPDSSCSRSLSGRCDLERGSSTDCEMLEGSVADCECKDVDTEKPKCREAAALSASLISSIHSTDNDGDGRLSQQQIEGSILTGTNVQSVCTSSQLSRQLLDNSDVANKGRLELQKRDRTCGDDAASPPSQQTDLPASSGVRRETVGAVNVLDHRDACSDIDIGSQLQQLQSADTRLETESCDTLNRITDSQSAASLAWSSRDDGPTGCAQVQDHADVQAMSVSEDDESSGDTDYVVLGEPISKQTEAVNQAHRTNTT